MAEFVQFRAEEWVTELEQMERIGLFESKEIKSIVAKRKEFEYKLQRKTKCKEDYLKYIKFEIDLNRIVKARRKKSGIKVKKAEIDHTQTRRIASLFKCVIFKFPNDIKLWMSFFKFCEGVKYYSLVSQMLVRMLKIHSNKPDLWIFAAKWEFERCNSINNARQFLTRGLRHHPSSSLIYQELFKLEIGGIKEKMKEISKKKAINVRFVPDKATNNVISGKVAEVVYDSAVKEIDGVDFKVTMFNISIKVKAPLPLKNKIFMNIVKNHLDEELAWATIANQEFNGFPCDLNQLIGEEEKMEVDEEKGKEEKKSSLEAEMEVDEEKEEKEKEKESSSEAVEKNEDDIRMKIVVEVEKEENSEEKKEEKKSEKTIKTNEVRENENKLKEDEEKENDEYMKVDEEKIVEREKTVKQNEETDVKNTLEGEKEKKTKNKEKISFRDRIQRSINVYEEAVKKFNSVKMWSLYLDFVLKLNKNPKALIVYKSKLLRNAMEGALISGNMAEKYYIEWISRLQKSKVNKTKLSEVLKKGTEHHPKSLKLWYARVKFCLSFETEELGMEVFREAVKNVTDDAPIWSTVVKHLISKSSPKAEEVLQEGIKKRGEVAQTLKPYYVEWLVRTKGIEKARTTFESAEMNLYPCLELYRKMAALELEQAHPCINQVRRCHELACKYFGENNSDVWLDYARFELKEGDISKVAQIHRRALKALKPELTDEFLIEFNKFKINLST